MDQLTKKERKELRKMEQQQDFARAQKNAMITKLALWIGGIVFVGGGLWWLISVSSKPLPGKAVEDLGRTHVKREEWEKYKYNSNPPTSGSHDSEWIRAGIYDEPQGEGNLIHSLEHGYVIISYNCARRVSRVPQVPRVPQAYAHDDERDADGDGTSATGSSELQNSATKSAEMTGDAWKSKECTELKKQLKEFAESQRLWKLIVVPRPQLDTRLALTAWARIDTFDPSTSSGLSKSDKDRMAKFIDAFRDQGPERTEE